ncbi:hypothetical protein BC628DRAFT_1517671 [Trametes gibbosa]|uniref:C2H2-type domain-containing protein n=1 Tax=Trametes gibbosa TaxID=160864 RepID=A0A6G6FQF8_9APHY|nr:hypothetical protein BC628DRAFT_1517671 [Trametes gibbosa]QIE48546.1 hypothetical protein [Trametes gibbosa]
MDSSNSTATTLTLRKRKHRESLVIHLSSPSPSCEHDPTHTESEYEPGQTSDVPAHHVPTPGGQKRYPCNYEGCPRSYSKPSRLAEHERSHTGDRPFVCPACSKSYLREHHLQAHARTHLPSSFKPFACGEEGCGKQFWTAQHLRVHSELHRGEKPFKCSEPGCDAAFSKHHQLREHICRAHAPPGTKPYRCEHAGCAKSFATNQKLTAHAKTHDAKRYTCVHKSCLPAEGQDPVYYSTWSALQHHMRTTHPPTCPHPSCNGKTFTQQKGLRAHLKIHAQRDEEGDMDEAVAGSGSGGDERPRKRRRGGEVGRDWVCDVDGCDKDFKSKNALTTHHNIAHLGRRDFVCPHDKCKRAFGYKHLLQRHVARLHALRSSSEDDLGHGDASGSDSGRGAEDDDDDAAGPASKADGAMDIEFITGTAYATRAKECIQRGIKLQCPFPHLPTALVPEEGGAHSASSSSAQKDCRYVFSRAYDLRRHLQAEHDVFVDRDNADGWVRLRKQLARSAAE